MTYRGLPMPVRIALALAIGVAAGVVLALTLPAAVAGIASLALATPEKLPWIGSRTTAFVAYLAIVGSVVYGLLLSTKILDAIAHRPVSFALHQELAAVGLGLAGIHGALLGLDRTIHFSLADLLVPFASPYRPVAVGLGQLALYSMVIVTASFYARRRIGQRTWRAVHYLTFLAFVGVTAHGILAGTDTATPWAFAIYAGSAMAVVFLTTYRIVLSVAARRERTAAPGRAPAPVALRRAALPDGSSSPAARADPGRRTTTGRTSTPARPAPPTWRGAERGPPRGRLSISDHLRLTSGSTDRIIAAHAGWDDGGRAGRGRPATRPEEGRERCGCATS